MTQYGYRRFGKQRFGRGVLLITLLLGLQLFFTGKAALAHVTLIRAEPTDGEALANPPSEMQFWFSEAVVIKFSAVQLMDAQNQVVPGASLRLDPADPTLVHVALPPLKNGSYTLLWKAFAQSDGHISQGFSAFSVGTNVRPTHVHNAAAIATADQPALVEGSLRWGNFLLLASLVGALAIVHFCLRPIQVGAPDATRAAQSDLRRGLLRWAALCASGAWLIGFGLLGWQVMQAQTALGDQMPWFGQAWAVLTQTHWGTLWLVRQALLLFLSGGLWWFAQRQQPFRSDWTFLIIAGRSVDLLIVQALAGHALSSSANWLLALGNAAVHLVAASLWMGGLIALALIALPMLKREAGASSTWQGLDWRAFSKMALLSVGLLIASGLFSLGQQVASVDALLTTVYGQLLVGKLGLVLLAALCGLLNTFFVHPGLAAPLARRLGRPVGWTPLGVAGLPKLIGLEVALGVLIFALTGLLTATPPPRGVEFTLAPADISHSLGQRVGQLFITLDVTPNQPGRNLFSIRNVATQGATTGGTTQVLLRFTSPTSGDAPVTAAAESLGDGRYQLTGNYLKSAGPWQIEVRVGHPGQSDTVAHFQWTVAPLGALRPVVWSKHPLTNLLALLAGCWLLLFGLGWIGWRAQASRPPLALAPPPDEHLLGVEAVVHSSGSR